LTTAREHDIDAILKNHTIFIGRKIKELRIEKGYNQLDLAFYSRTSQKTIYNIEEGCDNITLRTIVSIADALEVNLSEFFL